MPPGTHADLTFNAYDSLRVDATITKVAAKGEETGTAVRFTVEAGKVTEADLLQITAQLYSARNDVLTAIGDYDMARLELCQLLEIEDFRDFEAATSAADAMPSLVPEDEGGILEAVGWRPEIKSAELGVELARKDLQIARSSYWPTVSLSAGYGTSHSGARQMMLQNPDGTFRYEAYPFFRQYADNASSYVSVSLSIPILSGLSVRKNVRRTKTALRDAEYALASTRKGIVKEYLQAGKTPGPHTGSISGRRSRSGPRKRRPGR